jgi:hypothetical protein
MTSPRRVALVVCLVALAGALAPRQALAQAWVPAKGEGAVGVAIQNQNVRDHILTTTRVDVGHINTFALITDFTYGLTDKIAVDVALPFVTSKYTGDRPHPTPIDDGTFHSSFADFRFALRYNLTRGGAVITPYIGSIVPSHAYEFFAHSAVGERLHEVQIGAYVAKLFEHGLPGAFISGRFGYGFTEKVLDISHNRSMFDLELGYFFAPSFRAFVNTGGQYTHGGIDLPPVGGLAALAPQFRGVHDQIDRAHSLKLGGGAAYSLTDSVDIFGSFVRTMTGRNEHALRRGITVGASWSFSRRKGTDLTASRAEPDRETSPREGSLIRCICQKSGS